MPNDEAKPNPLAALGSSARNLFGKLKGKIKGEAEKEEKPTTWRTDAFWLYRWFMDFKYKRAGLTTITWLGEEYGYRMDYERVPKKQINEMRRSLPNPVHKSNSGWNEWVLLQDSATTPFPEVKPEGAEYYQPTAVDLYLYMTNKDLDNALVFKKKNQVPIDGKMLLLCVAGVAVLVLFMLGMFS